MKHWLVTLLLAAVPLAACGGDDKSSADDADRIIELDMTEFAYEPSNLEVEQGQTVRFLLKNTGRLVHEAVIGDERLQADHEEEAAEEGMHHGGGGDDAEVSQADAGDETELIYTFEDAGELLIGCHEPGHYEEGMVARVTVT
ncbi:MAG: plastocyanin/azurin family copper-binding protein [Actinomycetota bacterium]|nr:plastocyanin/azurin family copper-binding protein [Actinomycetota bacterium]